MFETSIALAQNFTAVNTLIGATGGIVRLLLPITVTLALLFFVWGLAQFIRNSGGDEARSEGRNKMIWGIVALFAIVSIWGIIAFIGSALNIYQGGSAAPPTISDEGSVSTPPRNVLNGARTDRIPGSTSAGGGEF